MNKDYVLIKILDCFAFEPTNEQSEALKLIVDFITSKQSNIVLLLKGYAGTGKTTLLSAVVKMLTSVGQKTVLLAPTGRAAKVFSGYSGHDAFTIHKKIYRQKQFSGDIQGFSLSNNMYKDTVFFVDEASMISNSQSGNFMFGSGKLLDDLIHYVYSGENCRLILIGDSAQLPPVSLTESPALNIERLGFYDLTVMHFELTQVVRQEKDSGILFNATNLRDALRTGTLDDYPKIQTEGFKDIEKITGSELIEEIASSYSTYGIDDTIIICRSNKNANLFNRGIRNQILYREEELSGGDRLLVVKNNYFWGKENKNTDFIANGEIIRVLRVRNTEEVYGFRFCDLLVRFDDYDFEIGVKVILDSLHSESPSLSQEQNNKLYKAVEESYSHIKTKGERIKKIKEDPYFNALQIKYAYAVTCHKSQGGQWSNVFLDIGYVTKDMMGEDFYRWLYTAFTRATNKLFLVNWKIVEK